MLFTKKKKKLIIFSSYLNLLTKPFSTDKWTVKVFGMYYFIPIHCRQNENHVFINKKHQTMYLASSLTPFPLSVCVVVQVCLTLGSGIEYWWNLLTVSLVIKCFSTEHKGCVPSKFSRFDLIWLVHYKYSDCKTISTKKKSILQEHIYYIFLTHILSATQLVIVSAPDTLHNSLVLEYKF